MNHFAGLWGLGTVPNCLIRAGGPEWESPIKKGPGDISPPIGQLFTVSGNLVLGEAVPPVPARTQMSKHQRKRA